MPARARKPSPLLTTTQAARLLGVHAASVLRWASQGRIRAVNGFTAMLLKEALDKAAGCKQPIHLLVTDVVMPKLGGGAMAELLGRLHPETKLLFMSGYTDDAIVHHGVLAPGISFLRKPFSPTDLTKKVRETLDEPAAEAPPAAL